MIGGETLFARWQQFAAQALRADRVRRAAVVVGRRGELLGAQCDHPHRQPSPKACGLPKLSGPEPFGGHVMSHDMLEAALLRRRGWACHMVAMQDGSYEEYPPTFVEHAAARSGGGARAISSTSACSAFDGLPLGQSAAAC